MLTLTRILILMLTRRIHACFEMARRHVRGLHLVVTRVFCCGFVFVFGFRFGLAPA